MLNNARTLALCAARSLLPRTVTAFSYPDLLTLAPRNTTKQMKCRYSDSLQDEKKDTAENDNFEGESPYLNIDFDAITGSDPQKIRQLKKIQLEIDMMRQQGEKVPTAMTTDQWIEALLLDTRYARSQYYSFLWLNEWKKQKNKAKRRFLNEEFLAKKATQEPRNINITTEGPIIYSLGCNSLFWRLGDVYMRHFYNLKLLYASMFSPHIIVDCSYEPFMTQKNLTLCVKQIMLMFSENRSHLNPFHLVFCNLSSTSKIFVRLSKMVNTIREPDFPFYSTPEHYLNLYPREKLVYLTPHCIEELHEYNSDDIYIIGGFVDKNRCEPLSLAKAKREKLRMAKFPIDKYIQWQVGTKSLTLNQSLAIMTDLKDTNDWNFALKNVPARKTQVRSEPKSEMNCEEISNYASTKNIREHYRRNLVYDLLMKDSETNKRNTPPEKK